MSQTEQNGITHEKINKRSIDVAVNFKGKKISKFSQIFIQNYDNCFEVQGLHRIGENIPLNL